MVGKGGSWGRLGAQDLKENTLEMSCQELGQCHCPPHPRIGEAWSNKSRWWEWMKTLQSGRKRYETLRRESSKQNLAKSSVPGQQAGSRAGAQLRKAAALLYFYSCKEFFTPLKIIAPPASSRQSH